MGSTRLETVVGERAARGKREKQHEVKKRCDLKFDFALLPRIA